MNSLVAKLGFSIACLCSAAFIFDFAWLQLRGRPFFGFRRESTSRQLFLWFLLGVTLMMITFPDIIATYDKCHAIMETSNP